MPSGICGIPAGMPPLPPFIRFFIRPPILPLPPIISFISRKLLMKRLTSISDTPEPLAIRRRRLGMSSL